jgi:hypothetical protein
MPIIGRRGRKSPPRPIAETAMIRKLTATEMGHVLISAMVYPVNTVSPSNAGRPAG